jgi:hypothetical protein
MKLAALILIICAALFIFSVYALFKARKIKQANDAIYEAELAKPTDPILKATLQGYGFKIYDTKDTLYALHPNGISMAQLEGYEWTVEIRGGRADGGCTDLDNMADLVQFCAENDKPIKKQEG